MRLYSLYMDTKSVTKIAIIERIIVLFFAILLIISVSLISIGANCDGAIQNILIGLGTGFATSFLVSLAFYITGKLIKKRESIINRDKFIFDFKMLLYRVIDDIDYCHIDNGEYDLQSYIKNQHRWFHDYYKRMVANNETKKETKERLDNIQCFLDEEEYFFESTLGYNYLWKSSDFSSEQKSIIEDVYLLYKGTYTAFKNHNVMRAFLDFSSLLQVLIRIFDYIDDLSSFKLIKYTYLDGKLNVDYSQFEEKERMLKFVREFNEIRNNNYIKQYGNKSNEEQCNNHE